MQDIKEKKSQQQGQLTQDQKEEDAVEVWTKEQVAAWRAQNPPVSLWWIVRWQIAVALVLVLLVWLFAGSLVVVQSVIYGALCAVLPNALFAHGLRERVGYGVQQRMGLFVVWEVAKIAMTIAMLYLAPKVIDEINWLALLAGFVVTIKLYWLALVWGSVQNKLRKTQK